ncbi:aminodeoxychorismate synthase component I [Amycolatopsis sp. H20-H5]|uniref:aminodeoxychorismate synthase component I n=1 Tax=Amycolatopsis sp. H20-H5 TaxID=3046309 RepID=UPI002DBC5F6E|nr:aminodeoxychorismate synthase component I [Amycolatopsis sp. H20-H5]MEC3979033.1 aminodeoxychorismate synthase component I [Amycolatopsis sp. H20-H5]
MRSLIIDNYDSYTFNLFQLIADVNGCEPTVLKNDDLVLATLDLTQFDNIVISPGPGSPQTPRDLGYVGAILARAELPVLGVCLGHQAIAHAAGATVDRAPQPRHGHLTKVRHNGGALFSGIPQDFTAVRYHSLCIDNPLPEEIEATAWAEDGVVMAIRHRTRPQWGVQFHPESIASEYGREIIANFRAVTAAACNTGGGTRDRAPAQPAATDPEPPTGSSRDAYQLLELTVPGVVDTEAAYTELFGQSQFAFWLDSSRVEAGLSRFSFLGDASGPLSEVLTYRLADHAVLVRDAAGVHAESGTIFDVLDGRLAERRLTDPGLPFDFTSGYVGYFGYELKGDLGARRRYNAETPDAAWIFADRLIAFDHELGVTYVVALHRGNPETRKSAQEWIDGTAATLVSLLGRADTAEEIDEATAAEEADDTVDPRPSLVRDAEGYVRDIEECQRQLVAGESYEICLTNKVRVPFDCDDLTYYRRLRASNPAPYAALLRLGEVTVFSSSPERFLKIDADRAVETKPIKGTAPRSTDPVRDAHLAAELASSVKTRAENLMIVDLLRNDLGRVCEIGSVSVPSFMAVESYATVHQLVSTVRGVLRPEISTVDCVRHCFPGGSMTGAPKLRTVEIIDGLETEARGIYSGSLGYLGLTGTADLNIVIRTAVRFRNELSVGAGGAIVLDSSPAGELDEMLLKAKASLRALPSLASQSTGRPL